MLSWRHNPCPRHRFWSRSLFCFDRCRFNLSYISSYNIRSVNNKTVRVYEVKWCEHSNELIKTFNTRVSSRIRWQIEEHEWNLYKSLSELGTIKIREKIDSVPCHQFNLWLRLCKSNPHPHVQSRGQSSSHPTPGNVIYRRREGVLSTSCELLGLVFICKCCYI